MRTWLIAAVSILGVLAWAQSRPSDTKVTDLGDGFVRVVTPIYSLEMPKGWQVTAETSFGQREMIGSDTRMTAMTAGRRNQVNWDELYRTAVWFSTRGGGKATPYKLSKSAQGYDAMSYSVVNDRGFATERYVILKAPNGGVLALSVKVPDEKREKDLMRIFDRLVRTADIK